MHSIKIGPDGGSLARPQMTIITPCLKVIHDDLANPVGVLTSAASATAFTSISALSAIKPPDQAVSVRLRPLSLAE
jgi:hypothetical protein